MDEGILNELLECSVCLERLDSSSKVLPCQHTFCKRCLEEIQTSRGELRCPECRILVETKINDLPNNFLLIRLLEGIKSVPRTNNKSESSSETNVSLLTKDKDAKNEIKAPKQDKPSVSSVGKICDTSVTSSQKQAVQPHPCAKALYSYESKEPGDLSFKKGDIIMLKKKIDHNWLHGELGNKHGFFPVTYVQIITPLPTQLPQAKALFDFSFHEQDEKDCLSFKKGSILTVIRRIDENWVEGKLSDKVGIFPITFVEMNSAARAIVKLSSSSSGPNRDVPPAPKQAPSSAMLSTPTSSHIKTTSSTTYSPSSTSQSPHSTSSVIPQPLPQPPSHPKHMIHRQQREKRHSVTTVTPPTVSSSSRLTNHRHSMDASSVLAPINIPSHIARPRTASHPVDGNNAKTTSTASTSTTTTSTPASILPSVAEGGKCNLVRRHSSSRREKSNTSNHARQHSAPDPSALSASSTSSHSVRAQVPIFYVAMYSYKPQKEDELELKKNDLYTVSEKCLDGWYKGTSLRNGQTGVFPGNYVQIAKSSVLQANFKQIMTSSSNIKNSSNNSQSSTKSTAPQPPKDARVSSSSAPDVSKATSPPSSVVSTPPPRPPRPQSSPWVTKSSSTAANYLPQPPKMTVALPPQDTSMAMVSSIPVPVTTPGKRGHAVCSTTASQSWHGAIPSVSLMSTASTVTPPNVAVTVAPSASSETPVKTPKEKKEKDKVSTVFKRLTGVKKKSKSPPPPQNIYSMDNPNFVDGLGNPTAHVHIRSGSCPVEMPTTPSSSSHKKSTESTDTHSSVTPRPNQPAPLIRERFRCIVPYPPNSDYELELKVGDIIFVHKKRDDGWYKGTLSRTGVTGLFPGSFVEKF